MSHSPTPHTSHEVHHPTDEFLPTKALSRPTTVIALIVLGSLMASRLGNSQEIKPSDAKKPDLSKRGAVGVFLYESEDHVLVSKVVPKSPAEKAGLQVGDDIRYVNNERIKTAQALIDEIASFHPGMRVDVVIRRAGERQTLKLDIVSHEQLFPDAAPAKPVPAASTPPATPATTMSPETARRMRVLEMQLSRLQAEMDQLKSKPYVPKPVPPMQNFDFNNWLEQHRFGDNDGDPSLFQ